MASLPSTIIPALEDDASFRALNPLGAGTLIRMERAALFQLEIQVRDGLQAINNRHGVEVGGLVLGSPLDWNAPEVAITGFVPVPIEHLFGPAFRPSETDIAVFKEAAAKHQGNVVGYFRSQLRSGAPVRMEDTRLLAELFPSSDSCFIEIHATAATPSSVDLYQMRPGSAPVLLEMFGLKENQVAAAPAEAAPDSVRQQNQEEAPVHNQDFAEPPSPGIPEPTGRARLVWIMAAAALLAISLGAYTFGHLKIDPHALLVRLRIVKPASGDAAIGLHMTERGAYVEIRWNPADPAMATAEKGKLIIADKDGQNILLSRNQLRSGLYLYQPSGGLVTVLLMVCQPDGSFTGDTKEFRSSHPRPAPPSDIAAELPPSSPQPESLVEPDPLPQNTMQAAPRSQPSPPPAASPATASPLKPVAKRIVTHIAPKAVASKPTRFPTVMEPPSATGSTTTAVPALALALPAPPPLPSSGPSKAPATLANAPATLANAPAITHRLLAPRLVRQATPAVPLGVASRIRTDVRLDVLVSVDADGKVTGAHVVSSQGAAAGLLAIEVLKAAQLCSFLPALQDGQPVNGSLLLTFRFSPATN